MNELLINLSDTLYRVIGPPWRLQRSAWPKPGWFVVSERPSSPLALPADIPDFITVNGETITVVGR